jgi:hypothetical protein
MTEPKKPDQHTCTKTHAAGDTSCKMKHAASSNAPDFKPAPGHSEIHDPMSAPAQASSGGQVTKA